MNNVVTLLSWGAVIAGPGPPVALGELWGQDRASGTSLMLAEHLLCDWVIMTIVSVLDVLL